MRPARALLVVALAALAAGCLIPIQHGGGDVEAERRELDAARAAATRDPALGRARLEDFLRAHPRSLFADDAGLALGRLDRAAGRDADAEQALRAGLAGQPRGDQSDASRLELADLLRARGDSDAAWQEAQGIRVSDLDTDGRRRAERLLADLAHARGDTAGELLWLARLREDVGGDGAPAVDAEIARAFDALPTDALRETAAALGTSPVAGRAWILVAERALAAQDPALATRALAQAARGPLDPRDAERRQQLEAALAGGVRTPARTEAPPPPLDRLASTPSWPAPASGTIGVVLPLSGPFGGIGQETLRGILLAAGVFGSTAPPAESGSATGMRVLVRDTGGSGARAAAAVRELAGHGEVQAVIGPLLTEEVQPAADAAQATGVPLLTLTRHESVVRAGAPVFRVGLTRRMEAEVLADHAVRELGMHRFAILHPDDEYGREFEERVWQALEARGGRVVAVAGYTPDTSDFSGPIRSLVGWSLLTEAERQRAAERDAAGSPPSGSTAGAARGAPPLWSDHAKLEEPAPDALPPIVDFDALFVPDTPDKVALVVPQLRLQGVEGVTLFGTSAWQHPDLLHIGPRLEGAFFTSAFDPGNPAPIVEEFDRRYSETFDEAPSAFAAQGFDAANLVALQLVRGASDRTAVAQDLRETRRYPGVSGTTTIDADGNARKRPFLVGVRAGAFVSLE
jgi:ABC-type branched-subunit amino acid transport system substrate-binding protein